MQLSDLERHNERGSETDVVTEFSHRIRDDGRLKLKHEVRMRSRFHRSGWCRIDAVVLDQNETIICALEFKRVGRSRPKRDSRQFKAYSELGIPFFYVMGRKGIKRILPLVFATAGFGDVDGAFNAFGLSAISRRGNIKGVPMYVGRMEER